MQEQPAQTLYNRMEAFTIILISMSACAMSFIIRMVKKATHSKTTASVLLKTPLMTATRSPIAISFKMQIYIRTNTTTVSMIDAIVYNGWERKKCT